MCMYEFVIEICKNNGIKLLMRSDKLTHFYKSAKKGLLWEWCSREWASAFGMQESEQR